MGMVVFGVVLWCKTKMWRLGVGLKWQGGFDARRTSAVQNFVRILLKCLVLFGSHVILHGVTRMHEVSLASRFHCR